MPIIPPIAPGHERGIVFTPTRMAHRPCWTHEGFKKWWTTRNCIQDPIARNMITGISRGATMRNVAKEGTFANGRLVPNEKQPIRVLRVTISPRCPRSRPKKRTSLMHPEARAKWGELSRVTFWVAGPKIRTSTRDGEVRRRESATRVLPNGPSAPNRDAGPRPLRISPLGRIPSTQWGRLDSRTRLVSRERLIRNVSVPANRLVALHARPIALGPPGRIPNARLPAPSRDLSH